MKKLLIIAIFLIIVCLIGWIFTYWNYFKMVDLMEDWQFQAVNCEYFNKND